MTKTIWNWLTNKTSVKTVTRIGLTSCLIMLLSGIGIANAQSNITYSYPVTTPLGMHEPSDIVIAQNSETTSNLYIILYVSCGITLASMGLAYSIFNRSARSLDQALDRVSQNILELTEATNKTQANTSQNGEKLNTMINQIGNRPCMLDSQKFWRAMSETFNVKQGIQGEQSIQGIQGIRGDQGIHGDRGDQGQQGIQGQQGKQFQQSNMSINNS